MTRSDYTDGLDQWDLIRWRGAVKSAIRGKRGQRFLADLLEALDALPRRLLIQFRFEQGGDVCAIACVARARGLDLEELASLVDSGIGEQLGIAPALVREVFWQNDEQGQESYAERWVRVRAWVVECLADQVAS